MSTSGTTSGPEVFVALDRNGAVPLRTQLEQGLRDAIKAGHLQAGRRLASTRVLAHDLGVSRRLVVEVYEQLVAEGYLSSRHGSGTVVTDAHSSVRVIAPSAMPTTPVTWDFRPGTPALLEFPRQAWRRAWNAGLASATPRDLSYPNPLGHPRLRDALSEYLSRVRGVETDSHRLLICAGYTQALDLICHALRARGARRVAMEDPGLPHRAAVISRAGLEAVPIPVDKDGIDVDRIEAENTDAVLLAPSHQFPTGVILSSSRREQLLLWARASGALLVEDDYDGEFRFDRKPVGALQALSADHVAYVGTTSKTLAPAVRLGWIAAPRELVPALSNHKFLADHGSPALEQLALATMIESTEYDRHLRRVRSRYASLRQALVDAVERRCPELRLVGAAAGLQTLALLPDGIDACELVERAKRQGLYTDPLARFQHQPQQAPPALVLGYANLLEPAIESGIALLAKLLH